MTQRRWLILLVCGMTAILTASPVFACTNFVGDFWVWGNSSGYDTTGTLAVQVIGLQPPNDPSQAMTQTVNSTVAQANSGLSCGTPQGCFKIYTQPTQDANAYALPSGTYDVNTINVGYANHTTWLNPAGDCMSSRLPSPVTKVGSATIGSGSNAGKITAAADASGFTLTVSAGIAGEYKIPTSYLPNTSPQEAGICISDSTSINGNQAPLTLIGGSGGAIGGAPVAGDATQCDCEPDQPHSDSVKLSANMIAQGKLRPDGVAAHHIVPGALDNAQLDGFYARKILRDYNIDINQAENGVFLRCDDNGPSANHRRIHTYIGPGNYLENIHNDLEAAATAGGRQGVLDQLQIIAGRLAQNTYPY